MTTTPPVLVAGSTGYLGSHLIRALTGRGLPVRALVRPQTSEATLEQLQRLGVQVVKADVADPGALARACAGASSVVSCMAADVSETLGTPESIDRDANIALFDAAAATGTANLFILVSTFEGQDARHSVRLDRAKEQAVDHVVAHAAQQGMDYVIVRPTAYFKDFTSFPLRKMQEGTTMTLIGEGRARYNAIDGAELAEVMADLIQHPDRITERQLKIGGPEALTIREVTLLAAQTAGRDPRDVRFRCIPIWLVVVVERALSLLGQAFPACERLAGHLQFAVYAAGHDSVAPAYGTRTVQQHYADLLKRPQGQEAPGKKGD